jgi:L-gulonate 3-dehydrogenase
MSDVQEVVALVGTGLIGRGWAMLFANAGCEVRLYDADPGAAAKARAAISENLRLLQDEGMIESAEALMQRLSFCATLEDAVRGAAYVQESVFESTPVKSGVFVQLGELTGPEVILASSGSGIPPEEFMVDVRHRERCLIAHPFNPPHLIPLVEIVRTRWTSDKAVEATRARMRAIGQKPVTIHKPVFGFAVNRLQAVVIDEAISLVRQGVIDPEDLDLCMSQGLGLRWAFMGPFETMDLNAAHGFKEYTEKYGQFYRQLLESSGSREPWVGEPVERIEAWRRSACPREEDVTRRRLWRDHMLMKLARLLRGARLGGNPP